MSTFSPHRSPHRSPVTEERDRLAAVRRLRLVDTVPEERFDRIVRIAETLFGVPMAEINLIEEDRQFTKAAFPAANAGKNTARGGLLLHRDDHRRQDPARPRRDHGPAVRATRW